MMQNGLSLNIVYEFDLFLEQDRHRETRHIILKGEEEFLNRFSPYNFASKASKRLLVCSFIFRLKNCVLPNNIPFNPIACLDHS